MFNNRDERVVLSSDFYNPYKVSKYVENIKTNSRNNSHYRKWKREDDFTTD